LLLLQREGSKAQEGESTSLDWMICDLTKGKRKERRKSKLEAHNAMPQFKLQLKASSGSPQNIFVFHLAGSSK
jgi:uncharacterized protein YcgL (UPF0745 family)